MFDRVTIFVSDVEMFRPGYEAIIGSEHPWSDFTVERATESSPATEGLHIAFGAPDRSAIAERWQAAVLAGFENDGEPGPRSVYSPGYHGGFVLDPAGNSVESVHHERGCADGMIDHVWLRVADIDEARDRFAAHAEPGGYRQTRDDPGWVMFGDGTRSVSLRRDGQPETKNVKIALTGGSVVTI
ncbi:MAG: hypothetical protein ACSLFD_11125 [Solirubrobacterales bacterium]